MSPSRRPNGSPRRRETARQAPIDPTFQTERSVPSVATKKVKKRRDFDPHSFLGTIGEGRKFVLFPKKQIIFTQGDTADAVFYIQTGSRCEKQKGIVAHREKYGSRVGVEDRGGRESPNVGNMVDTNPCPPTKDCPPFCWRTAAFQHQHDAPQHEGFTVQYCSYGARFATLQICWPLDGETRSVLRQCWAALSGAPWSFGRSTA